MMDAQTISNVNRMPAPTWSWLRMNEAAVEVPAGLALADESAVEVELEGAALGEAGTFERVLEEAAPRFEHLRRATAPGDAADRERAAAADDALDVPALSAYQTWAVELEESYTPARAFETGLGAEAFKYLAETACRRPVIEVGRRATARAAVRVRATDDTAAVAATDVIVAESGALALTILLDAPAAGTGLTGSALRVAAGPHARVDITCVQTAGDGFIALDDSGFFVEEGARVTVRHVVLGAGASFTGLAGDLAGDLCRFDVDTSYLGHGEERRDFNYELRHRGRRTQSNLDANGVLAGASKKCLRGTIDLVHGCKGSEGTEHETVLIADDRVDNKTVPVILCDEDDVAGNHGATIGHVRDDQLFYLMSRGISPEAAESLFVRAKLEDAAFTAPDEPTRAAVVRLGSALVDDFTDSLEEDAA